MRRFVRTGALLGAFGVTVLAGCGSKTTTTRATTAASRSFAQPAASPQALARALLTPADVAYLGLGGLKETVRTGAGTTGAGGSYDVTFVSGDPACRQVLTGHPVKSKAWAEVTMSPPSNSQDEVVYEDIESFTDVATAERIMQENRDQLANCHTFIGLVPGDNIQYTFTHRSISVPPMGQDRVAHELEVGEKGHGAQAFNDVEILSDSEVLFVSYAPFRGRDMAKTAAIATAAVKKWLHAP